MKIRTYITLLYTLLTATILFVFAFVIYISSADNRENEFFRLLTDEAITKANLYFEAKVDATILQDIYRSNREVINEVEVAIYNRHFELLYHDAQDIDIVQETQEMINQILEQGSVKFYQDKWQVVGLKYPYHNEVYVVTAAAYDQYGYTKLSNLRENLLMLFLVAIVIIFFTGLLFSKRAFNPINKMAREAKNIHASNLNYRLNVKNNNDEIHQLSNTFNEMLDRLENSFEAQKHFVSHISHELRTPLAATIAELELALNKPQTSEQYQHIIENTLSDSKKIVKLTNNILDFAKASYDASEIKFKPLRIDEIILDALLEVKKANPNYNILLKFDKKFKDFDNENALVLYGNEYLLKIAFSNLIENGCKFSENQKSVIKIATSKTKIKVTFSDQGIGIAPEELQDVFIPFYRGTNQTFASGNGIGLSLVKKIVELHQGEIKINSKQNQGTNILLKFNNNSQSIITTH